MTALFGLCTLFVLCSALVLPWRFLAPVAILLSATVAYAGVGSFLGRAKPAEGVVGWSGPALSRTGAVVLGGQLTDAGADLLLQEKGGEVRLYRFTDPDLRRCLLPAMEEHAKSHGGEHWGFAMLPEPTKGAAGPQAAPDAAGCGGGSPGDGAAGGRAGNAAGGRGGEAGVGTRSPFNFGELPPAAMPSKG